MTNLTPERLAELRRNDEAASHNGGCLYRLKSDYSHLAADVDAAIEALLDERDALRAEVERLRTDGASAVRWAPSSAYWSDVLRDLFGPDARKGIDLLETRWRKELERADKLAEALEEREQRNEELLRQALEEHEQRDEALLRQALDALKAADWYIGQLELLVYSPDDTGTHEDRAKVQSAIAALRERLGEGEQQ